MNSRFKRKIYLGTTSLFYLTLFGIITYICWFLDLKLNPNYSIITQSFLRLIIEIVFLVISFFIVLIFEVFVCRLFASDNLYTILSGIEFLDSKRKEKYVYHSKLGEFLVVVDDEDVSIFKQNYLSMLLITKFPNNSDKDFITKQIKKELDNYYFQKLNKIIEIENKKNRLDVLDEWDGYLDTETRRDNKIDKILK